MSKFYDVTVDEVLSEVQSDRYNGITKKQVKERQKQGGKNIIYPVPKGFFREYLRHILTDYTSVMLLVAAAVCVIFNHDSSAFVVAGTILFSYLLCSAVFLRSQKVLENMGSFALPVVKVMRGGRLYIARSQELVRGDIIFLCSGDVVPADVRLVESDGLVIDETVISGGAEAGKNAEYLSSDALELTGQRNMAFAGTVVLGGSGKAVVVGTGKNTVICKMRKNKPIVSHDKLRVLDRIRKIFGYIGIVMLAMVFALTAVSLFLAKGEGLFDNLLLFLSLAVASMSELYMAFGYIIVACGVFSALRQYKSVNAGALIKNTSKLEEMRRINCIMAPRDGCFLVDELSVGQIYYDDVLYGIDDKNIHPRCSVILEYAVISTGIYGGANLVSINSAQNNIYTTEESAIINCAREHSLYNYTLDKDYPFIEHKSADELNPFDTTLVKGGDSNLVVVRGDAMALIARCTHKHKDDEEVVMSAEEINELMLAANRMSIGGYRVCAVATKQTAIVDLRGLSRAQARLVFQGFVVFKQTLLPDAIKSVRECAEAGIKTVMFTATSGESDRYVARTLGIIKTDDEIISGAAFARMDDGLFVAECGKYSLLEGFTVAQKRKAVHLYKSAGYNVAYLGSDVNESAVLHDADVGYCQSVTLSARADGGGVDTLDKNVPVLLKNARDGVSRGCDALKLTADVIVSSADGNGGGGFNAVVNSLCVAKGVYENLFHMLMYLLCTQASRLLLVLVSVFTGLFSFSAAQIIISGLIVDLFAVIVFSFDKTDLKILSEKATFENKLSAPLRYMWPALVFALIWAGCSIAVSAVCAVLSVEAGTVTFISFLLSQTVCIAQFRKYGFTKPVKKRFNNIFAFLLAGIVAFVFAATQTASLARLFALSGNGGESLLLSLITPFVIFVAFTVVKIAKFEREELLKGFRRIKPISFKRKSVTTSDGETEEFINRSFGTVDDGIEYLEEQVPDKQEYMIDDKTARELVCLSVLCVLDEWSPVPDMDYGEIAEEITISVSRQSSLEVIATVLIATLSAHGISVRFDDCMKQAEKMIEYMQIN
ncbi:MAG: cation-transporting P-type ATPase [Clostridia bacterium]|nr:cation-transporting P-type ATPase [Clostridia bacterium]